MDTPKNLQKELTILERFVELTPDYLRSDALFYPTGPNIPEMTFGGAFIRQHRLLMLSDMLSGTDQMRLNKAIANLEAGLSESIVRFEQKAERELKARLRQWKESVRELLHDREMFDFYDAAVEARVMIDILLQQMSLPPYQQPKGFQDRVQKLDFNLQMRWIDGAFVWDQELKKAYPQDEFWYLYGSPA